MNVNANDLLLIIGSQQVEIQVLRKQVADLQAAGKAPAQPSSITPDS